MTKLICFIIFLITNFYNVNGSKETVVGIYTDFGNRRGQGTGFCISGSGEILTAYHVVYGAKRVDVIFGGIHYKDVIIQSVLPETDLALLKLPNKPDNLYCHHLAYNWSAGQPVYAIGYARGIPNQRYDGTVTQNGTLNSEQYRDNQGRKLFINDDIKLISLDITIENGISGSPIITGNGVIGVLSGSIDVGRRLSWAIPVSYLRYMRLINKKASQIYKWPDFGLTQNWTNLRNMFRIDNDLALLIDNYYSSIDNLTNDFDEITVKINFYQAGYLVVDKLMTTYLQKSAAGHSDLEALESNIEVMGKTQLLPRLEECVAAFNRSGESEVRIQNIMSQLYIQQDKHYSGLARTELNLKNDKELTQTANKLIKKYDKIQEQSVEIDPKTLEGLRILAQMDQIDISDKSKTIRILKEGLTQFNLGLQNWNSLNEILQRNNLVEFYREVGMLFEWIFYRNWDRDDNIYRYTSTHGYSLVMPRGWVEYSSTLLNLLPKGSISGPPAPDVDLCFIKTGYFGDNRKYLDVVATSPHSISPQLTDLLIQTTCAYVEPELSAILTNFRNLTCRRKTFGNYEGILLQGLWGSYNNPFKIYNAWILGPGKSVWVNCNIRSNDHSDDYKTISESVKFK